MLSVIILCDLIMTVARAGCSMHEDNKGCSIAVISLFGLLEVVFIVTVGVLEISCRYCKNCCSKCCSKCCQDCCRCKNECQTCGGTKCTETECRNTCSATPHVECTEEECKNKCPCCKKCGNKSHFCGKRQRRDDEESVSQAPSPESNPNSPSPVTIPECLTCQGTKCEETKCRNSCNATQHVRGECTEEECMNKCPCCEKCRNKSPHCGVKHRIVKEQDNIDSAVRIVRFFAVLVASSLYFVGDNLLNILDKYGEGFNCKSETDCYKHLKRFSISCLAIGGALYIIALVFKIKNKDKAPQNSALSTSDGPISILLYLLYLPIFDSIYTGVVTSIGLSDGCTTYHSDVRKVYGPIYTLIAASLFLAFIIKIVLTECTPQGTPTQIRKTLCCRITCQILLAFIVVGLIVGFLLADNKYPINCEITNIKGEISFRIIFLLFTAPFMFSLLIIVIIRRCRCS